LTISNQLSLSAARPAQGCPRSFLPLLVVFDRDVSCAVDISVHSSTARLAVELLAAAQGLVKHAAAPARLGRVRLVHDLDSDPWVLARLVQKALLEVVVPRRRRCGPGCCP